MNQKKVVSQEEAIKKIKNGDSIMVGGFTNFGGPCNLLYELKKQGQMGLTTISEDLGWSNENYDQGISMLIANGQIKKVITSFIGNNLIANQWIAENKLEYSLIPQGTLAERIRAAGAGLGGFYTPTGVGTVVEKGKETKIINGKKYILELPLSAKVALVKAHTADTMGNAFFRYTGSNFNIVMAMAADIVILETENLVNPGEIAPDLVQLPGVLVDYIVHCGEVAF